MKKMFFAAGLSVGLQITAAAAMSEEDESRKEYAYVIINISGYPCQEILGIEAMDDPDVFRADCSESARSDVVISYIVDGSSGHVVPADQDSVRNRQEYPPGGCDTWRDVAVAIYIGRHAEGLSRAEMEQGLAQAGAEGFSPAPYLTIPDLLNKVFNQERITDPARVARRSEAWGLIEQQGCYIAVEHANSR